MSFEFPKSYKIICLLFCIVTLMVIFNRGSPFVILAFGSVPIAILLACIIMQMNKTTEEFLIMFESIKATCNTTLNFPYKATYMLKTYIKHKKLLNDLIYINYNSLNSFDGIESMFKSLEDIMVEVSRMIYSRIAVAETRGVYSKEDVEYINKYFGIGNEAISQATALLNEISRMGQKSLDMSYISSFINNLRKLNNSI